MANKKKNTSKRVLIEKKNTETPVEEVMKEVTNVEETEINNVSEEENDNNLETKIDDVTVVSSPDIVEVHPCPIILNVEKKQSDNIDIDDFLKDMLSKLEPYKNDEGQYILNEEELIDYIDFVRVCGVNDNIKKTMEKNKSKKLSKQQMFGYQWMNNNYNE